ncbi:hypothetical protein SAMN05421636_101527 [Pricia antarctica]|uniref:Uncharacterized protein n=1 Tax=Pricia antarctica TaxID=641691 RepID=A0A1G6X484_9FLAO|nr:hypothetical protein SAMN05421636_101527 [Pricia antarctica]
MKNCTKGKAALLPFAGSELYNLKITSKRDG